MRVLIFSVLILFSASVFADDSYLCVADKVTGFGFDKGTGSWEVTSFPADQFKFTVRPLTAGSEDHKNGYTGVVQEFGDGGSQIALCTRNSNVYGGLNCGESRDAYKFNVMGETMRFVMTFSGSYMTSTREVAIEGQDVTVSPVPDKGGKSPFIAIGQCSVR